MAQADAIAQQFVATYYQTFDNARGNLRSLYVRLSYKIVLWVCVCVCVWCK